MTLADMEQDVRAFLLETEGQEALRDPFTVRRLVTRATDWFAQQTDAFWYAWQDALTSGQTTACAPMLYKVRSLNFLDGYGKYHPMLPKTAGQLDGFSDYFNWRNWQPTQDTTLAPYLVVDGMNAIRFAPPANFTTPIVSPMVNPAIEFEGYALPSQCFKGDGVTPLFAAPTDECPLNAACHPGIVSKAMELRIMQRPTPENMARLAMVQAEVTTYLGALASFAFNFTPPYRFDQRKYRWAIG